MRRILAIMLLIAFGSPLVLTAFASPTDPQRNLPACCRRTGVHHCNGLMPSVTGSPAFKAPPCANYPSPATPVSLNTAALPAPATFAADLSLTAVPPLAALPCARIAILCSNLQRGPPSLLA
jgi:hypothetical protein